VSNSFGRVNWFKAFSGVLIGTAVGDSLGLPAEGKSTDFTDLGVIVC